MVHGKTLESEKYQQVKGEKGENKNTSKTSCENVKLDKESILDLSENLVRSTSNSRYEDTTLDSEGNLQLTQPCSREKLDVKVEANKDAKALLIQGESVVSGGIEQEKEACTLVGAPGRSLVSSNMIETNLLNNVLDSRIDIEENKIMSLSSDYFT